MSWLSRAYRATAPSFLGGGEKEKPPSDNIAVSKHSSNAGLVRIYGKRRVPAIKVFKTTLKEYIPLTVTNHDNLVFNGRSENNSNAHRWLHRIDVWGEGPITGIERYRIDGDPHTADRFDARAYFRAIEYYGSATQTAYSDLTTLAPLWDVNHKGQGVAYSATRFLNRKDNPQFTGEPEVHADVLGLALYDPREDPAQPGGNPIGVQDADTPSTWTYSTNNALVLLDFLRAASGRNLPIGRINIPAIMAGAVKCDVAAAIPAVLTNDTGFSIPEYFEPELGLFSTVAMGAPYPNYRISQVGLTQPRLSCNIALDPAEGAKKNVQAILNTMRASLPFSQGQFKLVIEDVRASDMPFDEDAIIGGLRISKGDRSKRFNQLTLEFPNENKEFKKDHVVWPPEGGADHVAYLAEDNGEPLHKKLAIEGITDFYQAEDLAEFIVRESRSGMRVDLVLAPKACLLEPGDVIDLTHSTPAWVAKLFRVRTVEVQTDRNVKVSLSEYDASVYTWSTKTAEPLQPPTNLPNPWADLVAIAGLSAAVVHETKADGTVISGLDISWTEPADTPNLDQIEIAWKLSTDGVYSQMVLLEPDNVAFALRGLTDGLTYNIRARYRTQYGIVSPDAIISPSLTAATGTKLGGVASGATVGGTWGVNLSGQPSDAALLNINQAYTEVSGTPTSLGNINAGEGSKLGGIATGATVGGTWGVNLTGQPTNAALLNINQAYAEVSGTPTSLGNINSAEGVKLTGISTGATVGGAWGTNISGRPGYLTDGRISGAINTGGDLVAGTIIDQGNGVPRVAPSGTAYGSARDGVPVSYSTQWDSGKIPEVRFTTGGISSSATLTNPVIQDYKALSPTVSGFTPSLRLKELTGTITPRTDTGATEDITDVQFSMDKSQTAEAYNDTYTFQFDVTVINEFLDPGIYAAGEVVVQIWIDDGGGFFSYGTLTVTGATDELFTTRLNQVKSVTVDGVGQIAGKEFRIVNASGTSPGGGRIDAFDSVKYDTAGTPSNETATPTGADDVQYQVVGGTETV